MRRLVLGYVLAVGVVEFFAYKILDPFYLQFLTTERGVGLTPAQFGVFVALGGGTTMAVDYLTGALADKVGRRLCWALSMFVYAGAMFWLSRVTTFGGALLTPLLQGLSWALVSGSREAWLYEHVGCEGTRRAVASVYLCSIPLTVGAAALATWLGTWAGIRLPIALAGLIMLAVGCFTLTFPENYGSRERNWAAVLRSGLRQFLGARALQLLALQGFFTTLPVWINSAWWFTFLVREWKVEVAQATLAFGIAAVAGVVAGLLVSRLRATDYRGLLVYPSLAAAASYLLMSIMPSPGALVGLVVVTVTADYLQRAGITLLRNRYITEERATALSFLSTLQGAFWVVGPLLWSAVIGALGLRVAFVIAGACCLVSLALLAAAMAVPPPGAGSGQ